MRSSRTFLFPLLFSICKMLAPQTPAGTNITPNAPGENVPTFHATSRLVLVDVVVTDKKGNFIQGLRPGDFTVFEDGKPQRISAFSAHSSLNSAGPGPSIQLLPNQYTNFSVQPPDRPITIVLLDTLNTDFLDQAYARNQMLRFLENLPPGEPVALFVMHSRLAMLQGFTESSDKLIAAAKELRAYKSPLYSTEADLEDAEFSATLGHPSAHSVGIGLLGSLYNEEQFRADQRVRVTLQNLVTLGQSLSGYAGRKNLIWLTGGIPFFVGQDLSKSASKPERDYFEQLRRTQALLASTQIAIYPVDVRGMNVIGTPLESMSSTYGAPGSALGRQQFNLSDTIIAMRDIARETGGKSFSSTNDLESAMRESLQEGMNYYTLAYAPDNRDWDGLYRKIEVKSSQTGAKLAFRRGYYAILEEPFTGDEAARMLASAVQPTVPVFTMLLMRVQVLPPDAEHKAVRIDYAVGADALSFADAADKHKLAKVDFLAVAWDKNLKDAGYVQNSVEASLVPDEYEKALHTGITMHQDLELKPGVYTLKVGIIDRANQKIGTVELPITVASQLH